MGPVNPSPLFDAQGLASLRRPLGHRRSIGRVQPLVLFGMFGVSASRHGDQHALGGLSDPQTPRIVRRLLLLHIGHLARAMARDRQDEPRRQR